MKLTRILNRWAIAMVVCVGMSLQTAMANDMRVTNVVLSTGDFSTYTIVQADISWDHSWRASWADSGTWTNWDAAWIFVKYRLSGSNWMHASLDTANDRHGSSPGGTINVGLSTNISGANFGTGAFLYRSDEGSGLFTNTVRLRWNYAQDGLTKNDKVDISVHAIEMVYVPQGSFYLGDGATANLMGQFEEGQFTNAFLVTGEGQLTLGGGTPGSLGNNNTNGMFTGAPGDDFNDIATTNLPATFPKGYNAFYCMKYEITQGQYADFLNMLTPVQAGNRYINTNGFSRYTIASNAIYEAGAPDRACNFLSWADGAAYADWAGLRPMTELEFEKACRGPATPIPNEFAWGNISYTDTTGFSGDADGSGLETALPAGANCNLNYNDILGPVRSGIYATAASGRTASGATYWGIMDMSGNLQERAVTVGNAKGRTFAGTHGDGFLASNGCATNNLDWPASWTGGGVTNAQGGGVRGGSWNNNALDIRASARFLGSYMAAFRSSSYGFRVARSAP